MPAGETRLSVANQALAAIGQGPVKNFSDATKTAKIVSSLYDNVIKGLLLHRPWSWTQRRVALTRLTNESDQPVAEYRHAFGMPDDRLGDALIALFSNAKSDIPMTADWEIHGDRLFANVEELWAEYQINIEEAHWPYNFTMAAIYNLAAEIAIPITQDTELESKMRFKFEGDPAQRRLGYLQRAESEDYRGQPQKAILNKPLVDAHYGYGGYSQYYYGRGYY